MKKFLRITGLVLLVLLLFVFLAPMLFKGKIISVVKTQMNSSLHAKVDFTDVDVSFIRSFPKLSVGIENLSIEGVGTFAGDTLVSAKTIYAALNLMSVISGDEMKIYSVTLNEPRIHALINKNGEVNWNIVKPDTAAVTPTDTTASFKMNLQKYAINNGYIFYKDEQGNMSAEISGLNHAGSGDFTADVFTLKTTTTADNVNYTFNGIPYMSKVNANIDADISVDNKTAKYSFKTDKIKLNELALNAGGFFQLVNDSTYNMDISFNAPSTEFKHILSFVPAVYQNNFASIKTSGQALFNGFVKGTYSSTQIPAYNINLDVKNGFFQYPDLPKPVKNINLSVKVDNPDGVTDHTVVHIPKAHIEFDNDPFDFRLLVKNPVSDLFVDAFAKGKLDLSKITQFVKLEQGTKLSGILNADVTVVGKVKAMEKQQFNQFDAKGTIDLNNFFYAAKAYPDGVKLNSLLMTFNPKNVTLSNLNGKYMETGFTANGYVNNMLAYVLQNKPLEGLLNIKADYINVNAFMGEPSSASTKKDSITKAFIVPSTLNLTLNAAADKVHYDKIDIQNVSGSLQVTDETVFMKNVKGNTLGGAVIMNGYYSTKQDKKHPDIAFDYDVKGLDIQQTFYAFNMVQKLMPVGKFMAGRLTSQMSIKGKLGENMMPEMNSLSGNGNMLLLEGVFSKFQPLDKLASTLNVSALQNVSLKDVKTYFEIFNGKVLVKPFNFKVKDIQIEAGGLHGIDQSLEYVLNMKVPRALMGDKGNNLVNGLVSKANNSGVPVKIGDVIPLKVDITGSITNPQIKTDLKQTTNSLAQDMKQQAADFVKAKTDSAKQAIKDSVKSAKNQLINSAKDQLVKGLLGNKKDTATDKEEQKDPVKNLEETGKGLLKNLNPFKKN